MNNQPVNIGLKTKLSGFTSLIICSLGRDENIAQALAFATERKDIRRFVVAAVRSIVAAHCCVRNKDDGERPVHNIQLAHQPQNKSAQFHAIDRVLALLVDDDVLRSASPIGRSIK